MAVTHVCAPAEKQCTSLKRVLAKADSIPLNNRLQQSDTSDITCGTLESDACCPLARSLTCQMHRCNATTRLGPKTATFIAAGGIT